MDPFSELIGSVGAARRHIARLHSRDFRSEIPRVSLKSGTARSNSTSWSRFLVSWSLVWMDCGPSLTGCFLHWCQIPIVTTPRVLKLTRLNVQILFTDGYLIIYERVSKFVKGSSALSIPMMPFDLYIASIRWYDGSSISWRKLVGGPPRHMRLQHNRCPIQQYHRLVFVSATPEECSIRANRS